jgi:hypothetical protein
LFGSLGTAVFLQVTQDNYIAIPNRESLNLLMENALDFVRLNSFQRILGMRGANVDWKSFLLSPASPSHGTQRRSIRHAVEPSANGHIAEHSVPSLGKNDKGCLKSILRILLLAGDLPAHGHHHACVSFNQLTKRLLVLAQHEPHQ